jgi:hypothetical protein
MAFVEVPYPGASGLFCFVRRTKKDIFERNVVLVKEYDVPA